MPATKAHIKATNKWMARAYDRINLTVPKGQKDNIKAHAAVLNESVNAFIGRAIAETMERDGNVQTMSNRGKCIALLNDFSEAQLVNVAAMLQVMKQFVEDAIDSNAPNDTSVAAMLDVEDEFGA